MRFLPYLAAVFAISFIRSCASLDPDTVPPCVAQFANGASIDLSKLKSEDGRAKFHAVEAADGSVYYYDPCGTARADVTVAKSPCCGGSACLCWRRNNIFTNIGDLKSAEFVVDRDSGASFIDYHHRDMRGIFRHSRVFLVCRRSPKDRLEIGATGRTSFVFTLFSADVCQPRSAKSYIDLLNLDDAQRLKFNVAATIMAVCSVAGVLYVSFGIVCVKFREGTTGKEMIARTQVWRRISSLQLKQCRRKDGDAFNSETCDRTHLAA